MSLVDNVSLMITLLLLVSVWDVFYKKIPNAFLMLMGATGLTYSFISNGIYGVGAGLVTVLVLVVIFIVLWGVLGAGDVKLLAVMGTFIGIQGVLYVFVAAIGVLMMYVLVFQIQQIRYSAETMAFRALYAVPFPPAEESKRIAFSPYLLVGAILMFVVL